MITDPMPSPLIICIGAMLWDIIGHSPQPHRPGADVEGRIVQTPGGVACNIALALARRGLHPAMLSAVARDNQGKALTAEVSRRGIDTAHLLRDGIAATDLYLAIEDSDGLVAAIAATHALQGAGARILTPLTDGRLASALQPWAGPVVIDGNLAEDVLAQIATSPAFTQADLRIVAVSPSKATRLRPLLAMPRATFYLNRAEAAAIAGRDCPCAASAAEAVAALGAYRVLVTDGAAAMADARHGRDTLTCPATPVAIRRVTGAGDNFVAAHLVAELAGADRATALARASKAASDHVSGKDPI